MKTGVYGHSRHGYWAVVYDKKGNDYRIHHVSTGHADVDSVLDFFRDHNIDMLNVKRDDEYKEDKP